MLVREDPWKAFNALFKEKSGLDLNLYKPEQMRRRITSMMDIKGTADLHAFWKLLSSSDAELQWFMDRLSINVSEAFRNPEKWIEVRDRILPDLLMRTDKLKCWSAGCSFGAEAFTLATLLEEGNRGDHKIIGTDIDAGALRQAKTGQFTIADVRNTPVDYRVKYFTFDGKFYHAKPALHKYLEFRRGNLLSDQFESEFDLIMCRNVVIYFTESAKDELYRKFFRALKPGGYLLVGNTERITNSKDVGFEAPLPFFYQRPIMNVKDEKWLNAS